MSSSVDSSQRSNASLFSEVSQSTAASLISNYNFVVGGGSYAAIQAVKLIGKHIIPKVVQQNPTFKATITVITPNRESYWNVAAVRLIADPEVMKTHANQVFFPLEETLREYLPKPPQRGPQSKIKHELQVIQGKIMSIDAELNMLTYLKLTDDGTSETADDFFCHTITYHKLILATGASSSSAAFKLNGSTELTKAALRELQEATERANSICIVGAGGAGVELAGELSYKYKNTKSLTLYSAFDGTLERLRTGIADDAMHKLKSLGVEVVTNCRAITAYKEREKVPMATSKSDLENIDPVTLENPCTPPVPSIPGEYLDHFENSSRYSPQSSTSSPMRLARRSRSSELRTEQPSRPHPRRFTVGVRPSHSSTRSLAQSHHHNREVIPQTTPRTIVAFENGYRQAFDCYIPTTGNVPNSSYLPHSSLDENGYVMTDPFLRMANNNPYKDIYIYGDLVSGGNQNISDICEAQKETLKATLMHDLLGGVRHQLKRYKPAKATYYVPISCKDGVGQTMYGLQIPGFVVSIVKGKNFRLKKSKRYLTATDV